VTTTAKGFGNDLVDEREWALIHHLGNQGRAGLVVVDTTGDRTVSVPVGMLVVGGVLFEVTAAENVQAAANSSGSTRFDLVVVRFTWSTNTAVLAVKQGTPGGGPPVPQQDIGVVWEEPLARLQIANGQGELNASDILALPSAMHAVSASDVTLINISNTFAGFGSPQVGATFVAPPSGDVAVSVHTHMIKATTNTVQVGYSIRLGRSTTGTQVVAFDGDNRAVADTGSAPGLRMGAAAGPFAHGGLTPGAIYTAWVVHIVGGGTQQLSTRQVRVEPQRY
jgi:hypothetical protein